MLHLLCVCSVHMFGNSSWSVVRTCPDLCVSATELRNHHISWVESARSMVRGNFIQSLDSMWTPPLARFKPWASPLLSSSLILLSFTLSCFNALFFLKKHLPLLWAEIIVLYALALHIYVLLSSTIYNFLVWGDNFCFCFEAKHFRFHFPLKLGAAVLTLPHPST